VKIGPADPKILWLLANNPVRNKIGCHGKVSKGIKKSSRKYLSFGKKIVKIGPVDPEIICLKLKKKKLTQAKYIAILASLPLGLNNFT